MKDLINKVCIKCKSGLYKETAIFDGWDGILHCTNCRREVKRFVEKEEKEEEEDA